MDAGALQALSDVFYRIVIGGSPSTLHTESGSFANRSQFILTDKAKRGALPRLSRIIRKYPLGVLGAAFILLVALVAAFAPQLAPHDPGAIDTNHAFESPGSSYWFGTDRLGRDMLSRMMYGARVTLAVGSLAVLLATVVGLMLGVVAGASKGALGRLVLVINDALISIPFLILAMVLIAIEPIHVGDDLQRRVLNVSVAIAVGSVAYVTRVVRSATLAINEEQYIEAAQVVGCSRPRIIWRHVLPNVLPLTLVYSASVLGYAILTEAALGFLGLSVSQPNSSWGGQLGIEAQGQYLQAPWLAIIPGAAISLLVFSANMLGDAARDVLDPKLRRVI
ncbi:MAG: ABC transporter permease [Dehalococcoidia bacterium]